MKHFKILCIAFLFLSFFSGHSFLLYGQKVRVAVAANAQFVAKALRQSFEKQNKGNIEIIVSSSGKLTAQITHGAPYDIFLSADMKYPENLYKAGLTLDKPQVYATGSLVLWSRNDSRLVKNLGLLTGPFVKTVAVANPGTAPYGAAAIQALKKAGVYESVKNKLVFGESIAQVNQYLLSGAADVAFTAKSVVLDPALKGKGKWMEVDHKQYSPIKQGMVLLRHAAENDLETAQAFYSFLSSREGKIILKSYGYLVQ